MSIEIKLLTGYVTRNDAGETNSTQNRNDDTSLSPKPFVNVRKNVVSVRVFRSHVKIRKPGEQEHGGEETQQDRENRRQDRT